MKKFFDGYLGVRPGHRYDYDLLRVIAILLVIFQHTGERGETLFYKATNPVVSLLDLFLSVFSKIAVPLFFMLSGALLLDRTETIGKLLKKRVLRMTAVLLIFTVVQIVYHDGWRSLFVFFPEYLKKIWADPIRVPYWYLYSYIAALLMLPFLRRIAQNASDAEFRYLLILSLIFVSGASIVEAFLTRAPLSSYLALPIATSRNIFFMLMGYWAEKRVPDAKLTGQRAALWQLIGFSFTILCCILTFFVSRRDGYSDKTSLVFYNQFVSLTAIAVFFGAKYLHLRGAIPKWSRKLLALLGSCTFGIYLLEEIFRNELDSLWAPMARRVTSLPATFVWCLAVFGCGLAVTAVLRLIPPVRKLI